MKFLIGLVFVGMALMLGEPVKAVFDNSSNRKNNKNNNIPDNPFRFSYAEKEFLPGDCYRIFKQCFHSEVTLRMQSQLSAYVRLLAQIGRRISMEKDFPNKSAFGGSLVAIIERAGVIRSLWSIISSRINKMLSDDSPDLSYLNQDNPDKKLTASPQNAEIMALIERALTATAKIEKDMANAINIARNASSAENNDANIAQSLIRSLSAPF